MTKYPLPIEIVKGRNPIVSQEYGDKSNNDWYKKNGIDIPFHNGTDIIISGGSVATYGTKLVCPVEKALLNKVWFTDPLSTQGNGVKVQWHDERGMIRMVVWHCSECVQQDEYKKGDSLGYIGNSGLVKPAPSYSNVHAGAHLHLMVYLNEVLCNPRDIFDFTKWFISDTDTGIQKDLPPIQYFTNKIREVLASLFK